MKHFNDSSKKLYALCEKQAFFIKQANKDIGRCKKLVPILKKSRKSIYELYLKAESFDKRNSCLCDALLWLCDNFSFLEEDFKFCVKKLSVQKGKLSQKGLPFCYEAATAYVILCECDFTEEAVMGIAAACDKSIEKGLSDEDISGFPILLKSAVLYTLGNACQRLLENGGYTESHDDGNIIINAIKSLKFLSVFSFDKAFENCKLEKILKSDP